MAHLSAFTEDKACEEIGRIASSIGLTPQQKSIFQMIVRATSAGIYLSTSEIAEKLVFEGRAIEGISNGSIRVQISNLRNKLKFSSTGWRIDTLKYNPAIYRVVHDSQIKDISETLVKKKKEGIPWKLYTNALGEVVIGPIVQRTKANSVRPNAG